jgi:hypothetical protein
MEEGKPGAIAKVVRLPRDNQDENSASIKVRIAVWL